ncbi:MAG: hypothetical protein Q8N18_01280 [Opitutaceae bacterium]|nr:hypothetical protein [Opitutaceae bacterium]
MTIEGKQLVVRGIFPRIACLRHEWCDFLENPPRAVQEIKQAKVRADVFTYVDDINSSNPDFGYPTEPLGIAVLRLTTFEQWWNGIGFKARNKIRKGQKSGVDVRVVKLDDAFAEGVEAIYNESPIRQGRKFYHFGKRKDAIKDELRSFIDRSILLGAYLDGKLVGFTKLFQADNVLRTVHIIATLEHREKCVMDIMMAKAVEQCTQLTIANLHYGSWTDGGVGAFRTKHDFQRVDTVRYFVPLTLAGKIALGLGLHVPLRTRIPSEWLEPLLKLRGQLNALRFRRAKELVE